MTILSASRLLATLALLGVTLVTAGPAWSQDATPAATDAAAAAVPSPENPLGPDELAAGRTAWKASDCSNCHGWSGNGKDTGPVPPGPVLRESQIDYESLVTIIQCGIPSTRMPSHDRLAYTDDRCYGMKSADMGDTKPPKGKSMKPDEIAAVAAYVAGFLEGKGETTKAECVEYFGSETAACGSYK